MDETVKKNLANMAELYPATCGSLEALFQAANDREMELVQEVKELQKKLDSSVIYKLTYDTKWESRNPVSFGRFTEYYYFAFKPTQKQIEDFLAVRHDNFKPEAFTLDKIKLLGCIEPQDHTPFER